MRKNTMSTLNNTHSLWPSIPKENLDSKYEKCRNITEEIYKRINITFQIKKLETGTHSDVSDHCSDEIDSNELSNETDLFACDTSDSIPSSTDAVRAPPADQHVNINNNEEKKAVPVVYKRPRKRFRKRVKKRPQTKPPSDSDGSSDEALPLSRMVEVDTKRETPSGSPEHVMGVPKIIIVTKDLKPRILSPDKKTSKKSDRLQKKTEELTHHDQTPDIKEKVSKTINKELNTEKAVSKSIEKPLGISETKNKDSKAEDTSKTIDNSSETIDGEVKSVVKEERSSNVGAKSCTICNLPFRGERGLRRHMLMSHTPPEELKKPCRPETRGVKPA